MNASHIPKTHCCWCTELLGHPSTTVTLDSLHYHPYCFNLFDDWIRRNAGRVRVASLSIPLHMQVQPNTPYDPYDEYDF